MPRFQTPVAFISLVLLTGCASETEDAEEPAAAAAEDLRSGDCEIQGESGKRYTFEGGDYAVCWVHQKGPYGSASNWYRLHNTSGGRHRVKLALEKTTDTDCKWIKAGDFAEWTSDDVDVSVAGYGFISGKPQDVKHCDEAGAGGGGGAW